MARSMYRSAYSQGFGVVDGFLNRALASSTSAGARKTVISLISFVKILPRCESAPFVFDCMPLGMSDVLFQPVKFIKKKAIYRSLHNTGQKIRRFKLPIFFLFGFKSPSRFSCLFSGTSDQLREAFISSALPQIETGGTEAAIRIFSACRRRSLRFRSLKRASLAR